MQSDIIKTIRAELVAQADDKTKGNSQSFFKESIVFHGVKTNLVLRIAAAHFPELKGQGKAEIFALCEELLKSGYIEEAFVAFDWSYRLREAFEPADFKVFERWLDRYVTNWATCDTLCNHTVAAFVEKFPAYLRELKRWAKSQNRWFRRAAAVTLILPARKGKFLSDVFDIAGILLDDKDDLVQKGYGWMLKEAGKAHQAEVLDYIMRHKAAMSRTALRYAIEKMPPDLRQRAMAKD